AAASGARAAASVAGPRQESERPGRRGRPTVVDRETVHRRGRSDRGLARCSRYNVPIVNGRSGRRRIRLFVLLSGALILASLIPLAVAEAVLIRRNRRTLETLEEKYLTRSSAAMADHISAYYARAEQELARAADAIRLAVRLTGSEAFSGSAGLGLLDGLVQGQSPLVALRAV